MCIVLYYLSANSQYLTGFLKYLSKHMALSPKIVEKKKMLKSPPVIFRRKKKESYDHLAGGGGLKALVVGPLKNIFVRLPLCDSMTEFVKYFR